MISNLAEALAKLNLDHSALANTQRIASKIFKGMKKLDPLMLEDHLESWLKRFDMSIADVLCNRLNELPLNDRKVLLQISNERFDYSIEEEQIPAFDDLVKKRWPHKGGKELIDAYERSSSYQEFLVNSRLPLREY